MIKYQIYNYSKANNIASLVYLFCSFRDIYSVRFVIIIISLNCIIFITLPYANFCVFIVILKIKDKITIGTCVITNGYNERA